MAKTNKWRVQNRQTGSSKWLNIDYHISWTQQTHSFSLVALKIKLKKKMPLKFSCLANVLFFYIEAKQKTFFIFPLFSTNWFIFFKKYKRKI